MANELNTRENDRVVFQFMGSLSLALNQCRQSTMVLTQITKKTTPCLGFLASLDPF